MSADFNIQFASPVASVITEVKPYNVPSELIIEKATPVDERGIPVIALTFAIIVQFDKDLTTEGSAVIFNITALLLLNPESTPIICFVSEVKLSEDVAVIVFTPATG